MNWKTTEVTASSICTQGRFPGRVTHVSTWDPGLIRTPIGLMPYDRHLEILEAWARTHIFILPWNCKCDSPLCSRSFQPQERGASLHPIRTPPPPAHPPSSHWCAQTYLSWVVKTSPQDPVRLVGFGCTLGKPLKTTNVQLHHQQNPQVRSPGHRHLLDLLKPSSCSGKVETLWARQMQIEASSPGRQPLPELLRCSAKPYSPDWCVSELELLCMFKPRWRHALSNISGQPG